MADSMLVTDPSACDKATAASDRATAAARRQEQQRQYDEQVRLIWAPLDNIDLSELEGHDREVLAVMTTAEVEVHAGWHMTQQGIVKQVEETAAAEWPDFGKLLDLSKLTSPSGGLRERIACALCQRAPTHAGCVKCGRRCCRRCLEGDHEKDGGTGWFECKACNQAPYTHLLLTSWTPSETLESWEAVGRVSPLAPS